VMSRGEKVFNTELAALYPDEPTTFCSGDAPLAPPVEVCGMLLLNGPSHSAGPWRYFFMNDDLQPWIELSTADENAWIHARYDSGALPPGIASRMLKADLEESNRGRARAIPAGSPRGSRNDRRPTASSDWQRLVGWMREFSSNLSE
jgi:hypothetical protein